MFESMFAETFGAGITFGLQIFLSVFGALYVIDCAITFFKQLSKS